MNRTDWVSFSTIGKICTAYYTWKLVRYGWRVINENMDLRDEIKELKNK